MNIKLKHAVCLMPFLLVACGDSEKVEAESERAETKAKQAISGPWTHTAELENITVGEVEENATLEIITETAANREAATIQGKVEQWIEGKDFVALDQMAASLLDSKELDSDGV